MSCISETNKYSNDVVDESEISSDNSEYSNYLRVFKSLLEYSHKLDLLTNGETNSQGIRRRKLHDRGKSVT